MERKAKFIQDKELLDHILNTTEDDISESYLFDLFGEFNGEAKCNPYDFIEVPPGYVGSGKKKNKNAFVTTVGIYIYNKFFIEPHLFGLFGYINKNMNAKDIGKIDNVMAYALMEDKITISDMKDYLMKTQFIMPFVTILSPNHSEKILTCTKVINKKKDELIKKYGKELQSGDVYIAEKVEKELLDFAVDYIGDDPSMDTFLSGARGSISNNFKNMYVMKGAVRDPDPNAKQEYKIATSNYMDGVSKEEYALYSNSLSAGPYSRGKKTEAGGYWENLFISAFQHLVSDKEGTDCGTPYTISVKLTEKNYDKHMYNWIVTNNGLVELTSDNLNKFLGKTVKMRHFECCINETPCSKCCGNMFYRQKIRKIGLVTPQGPSVLKNKAMKAFHDSTVSTIEMDPMVAFGLI